MKISKLKGLGLCALGEKSHKWHFVDKIVRDVRKVMKISVLCQTVVFVMLFCGIGVRFPEIKVK